MLESILQRNFLESFYMISSRACLQEQTILITMVFTWSIWGGNLSRVLHFSKYSCSTCCFKRTFSSSFFCNCFFFSSSYFGRSWSYPVIISTVCLSSWKESRERERRLGSSNWIRRLLEWRYFANYIRRTGKEGLLELAQRLSKFLSQGSKLRIEGKLKEREVLGGIIGRFVPGCLEKPSSKKERFCQFYDLF